MKKTKILFNKPIYIGMSILDMCKIYMYIFYYNSMKTRYNDKTRLLYTDTDSLIMEIKTNDFYHDVETSLVEHFDASDYSKDNIYNMPQVNKKVLGKFKDELNGQIMEEFVGLWSKMYAYKLLEGKEGKKA